MRRLSTFVLVLWTGSIGTANASAQEDSPLAVVAVQASGHHAEHIPEYSLDGRTETSWSAPGYEQWIQYELAEPVTVHSVSLAFKHGESRAYTVCIELSKDGASWQPAAVRTSRPGSVESWTFEIAPAPARFVRITGLGNTENQWMNITRILINDRPLRKRIQLPELPAVDNMKAIPFGPIAPLAIWGADGRRPVYFDEWLPPLFDRELRFDELDLADARLEWIFTGPLGSVTLTLTEKNVHLTERFHDSPAYLHINSAKATSTSHPQIMTRERSVPYTGELQSVGVTCDDRLQLVVKLNGQTAIQWPQMFDLHRHQLNLDGPNEAEAVGHMLKPEAQMVELTVNPEELHQTIIGFGGIPSIPAYHELSQSGKKQWWKLLCEYNLLVHREYPMGMMLNESMDNWTRLEDTRPHYYADNFPNGEVSDWDYLRKVRRIGGIVMFEFWQLPPWIGDDVELYAEAMVNYCRKLEEHTGGPPEIVGVQNEITHPQSEFDAMTLALRRHLDEAGFDQVRIHMPDAGHLGTGIRRLRDYQQSGESWEQIDYTAVHMYDFQDHFQNPDRFDEQLRRWHELSDGKPFLSNEISFHHQRWQWPSYRVALTIGQLYHKNLVLADAAVLAHCWTLLTVEQPSYGWTRSLCVPDRENGFVPAASSHLLRVFGAFSRRVRAGMRRASVSGAHREVLASAYLDESGRATLVALNRGTVPRRLRIMCPDKRFTVMELTDSYHANTIREAPKPSPDGITELTVTPGAIVTLSNVALIGCPDSVLE